MKTEKAGRVDCSKCRHFKITWNPQFPYACKLLGFKSADAPSSVAYNSTGKTCEGFEPKDSNTTAGRRTDDKNGTDPESVIVTIGGREKRFP